EVLPMGVTALIPLFYLPLLNIVKIKELSGNYTHPVIFLFLGGFVIARALEKTKLSERIATLSLLKMGSSDRGIIIGFVLSTTFLSMWISNTATTVMMVPIALSVIQFLEKNLPKDSQSTLKVFGSVLLLAIAYSANIGGIMTPIGTPPNVVFVGYLDDLYQRKVDFFRWLVVTAPIAILLLVSMVVLMKKLFPFKVHLPGDFYKFISDKYRKLGPVNNPQKVTLVIFSLAVFLWIFKGLIHKLVGYEFINDTSVAILCGFLLFLIPFDLKDKRPVLDKSDIAYLPWNIVLLFGGGLAMASAFKEVGLIQTVAHSFTQLNIHEPLLILSIFAFFTLFLTEVMSNVALCVVALPLLMKIGETQGLDPLFVAMPAALCSSFAFSLPISTPPNAIAFGTERISSAQMLKVGIPLNMIALIITIMMVYVLAPAMGL
ncbi:MAG: SLC13/DASS family transporter, partial [Bdellovibrionales bacterium]|nr:SLC13 family permease [Bdellovibrionales bacterium]NQZ19766.1 SLC13/DASS family transporter [Bdellovibrionales bacterium]